MGLFLRQDGGRSELQTKIAAELQERMKERAALPQDEHEPAMLENQHTTRPVGVLISVLLFLLFAAVVWWVLTKGGIF
jgi:hypothetical protein